MRRRGHPGTQPTPPPTNRRRRHSREAGMTDPRTPGWTRTLPMPMQHSQKGWSLLRSAKRFWCPLVVRPRTWIRKPGPGRRSQLTPNLTVPLGRKGRRWGGKRGPRRSFFCGMGRSSRVRGSTWWGFSWDGGFSRRLQVHPRVEAQPGWGSSIWPLISRKAESFSSIGLWGKTIWGL